MIYHVSKLGSDQNDGSPQNPFRTINHAAQIAQPGDTVQVHSGTYREWVDPKFGGTSDANRIVYEAAPDEHPIIKGSEIVTDWEHAEGSIWKKTLPNTMFGDWNPYALKVEGDWLIRPEEYDVHLGDVYINGASMYEATSKEDLSTAAIRDKGCQENRADELIVAPELTKYRWIAKVDAESTTLYCNFQEKNPNEETIEINVRQCCFFPKKTGVNYITVRGFEIAHAYEYSEDVEKDYVISTTPAAYEMAPKGSKVVITVSNGSEKKETAVPNIYGLTKEEAITSIEAAKLKVGNVSEEHHETMPEGQVISQSPAANSTIEEGQSVDFVVSKGPEEKKVTYTAKINGAITCNDAALEGAAVRVQVLLNGSPVYSDTISGLTAGSSYNVTATVPGLEAEGGTADFEILDASSNNVTGSFSKNVNVSFDKVEE